MVIGIGNPLREDDRVGISVVERLMDHFGAGLNARIVYEADIVLAEEIAAVPELLVVDALAQPVADLFCIEPLQAASSYRPTSGYSSHLFDWPMILAMARDLFGGVPEAKLCGISAYAFGISEVLSSQGELAAKAAYDYLRDYLAGKKGSW